MVADRADRGGRRRPVVRRLRGEPLVARELWGAPLVLGAIGVYGVCTLPVVTPADLGWLAGDSGLGLTLGMVRGRTVRVFARDGVLWQRYRWSTLGVWVGSTLLGAGFGFLAVAGGMHEDARPMTLSIGVGLLGEALSIGRRALASGVPFAPAGAGLFAR
ncbi:DUF1453 domain-containing protein [Amycolatopsis antarctica]|uniref:DUF1453 domain-containing protein n=1 Tax=Amycolatopsis antarctica TaxID=1854586 RepID=UPI001F0AB0A1|nr:DUF1453 domain-containing protein [Amycolatopsis antarctica]